MVGSFALSCPGTSPPSRQTAATAAEEKTHHARGCRRERFICYSPRVPRRFYGHGAGKAMSKSLLDGGALLLLGTALLGRAGEPTLKRYEFSEPHMGTT